MNSLNTRSINVQGYVGDPDSLRQVGRIQARTAHELIGVALSFALVTALAASVVLYPRVPHEALFIWLTSRVVLTGIRISYSAYVLRTWREGQGSLTLYRVIAFLDGVVWGALGWALTPLQNLEVAVVTISVLIAVSCLGAYMLHVDMRSCITFYTPILVPNAFYALQRQDDLGVFCCVAVLGLYAVLLNESRRSNTRLSELILLRLNNEKMLKAQQEALRRAEQLNNTRNRFVASMSHEMRTPLHGILGLVRLLRAQQLDSTAVHQLDLIKGSGEHLVHVINDVLDFSSMEAGALPVHAEVFELAPLMREVTETSQAMALEKGVRLELCLNLPPGQTMHSDPVRLRQVLHNLVGNALKFTSVGHVRLLADLDDQRGVLMVSVEDTGIGIAEPDREKIFEAFHQAEGTYQRRFGGTGLGLTISRELCRAMGGDLTCRSVLGRGSVFSLTLPLVMVVGAEATVPKVETGSQWLPETMPVSAHVLLVEDNPVNAMVAEAEIVRMGLTVSTVSSGPAALTWLQNHHADVVLMDCEMPEMDGMEATRHIRAMEHAQARSPVRIVALTANGRDMYDKHCQAAGMNDYLSKPFRAEDMARVLSRQLGCDVSVA